MKTLPYLTFVALILVTALFSSVCAAEDGLVARYTFDEGSGSVAKDSSGNGLDGQIFEARFVKPDGGRGYVLYFDTPQARVDCGKSPAFDITGPITIQMWIRPETGYSVGSGEPGLAGKDLSSYMISFTGGCWWYINDTANAISCESPLGEWTHVVAVFDGKEMRLYRDGRQVNQRNSTHATINHSSSSFIIRPPVVWGGAIDPIQRIMIDDVRLYNRALSSREISDDYMRGSKIVGKETWSTQVKLTTHPSADPPNLITEGDYSRMMPVPPGSKMKLFLADRKTGKVLASHTSGALGSSGRVVWSVETQTLKPGTYRLQADIRDRSGKLVGEVSRAEVVLPEPVPPVKLPKGAARLNNFVVELVNVSAAKGESVGFECFRDGWVFISAPVGSEAVLDGRPVPLREDTISRSSEAMQFLAKGRHNIRLIALPRSGRLIVRSMPEIIYSDLGYGVGTWIRGFGDFGWDYLVNTGILRDVNTIIERKREPANESGMKDWFERGRRAIGYGNVYELFGLPKPLTAEKMYGYFANHRGFADPELSGTIVDEFSGGAYLDESPKLGEAIDMLRADPKSRGKDLIFYAVNMYAGKGGASGAMFGKLMEAGYKVSEEMYLPEQRTLAQAKKYLEEHMVNRALRYRAAYPGSVGQTIANMGHLAVPPEQLDVDPQVDWKVWMDMQMNVLANNPAFRDLYGVAWYHSAYAGDEYQRWAGRLYRHYCVEGKKTMLSKDPYILPHVLNGDFENSTDNWTVAPAEPGSISVKSGDGYSFLQGRYPPTPQGNTFLWMKRSAKAPNTISQPIEKLKPGRLYSMNMFVSDYRDLTLPNFEKKEHPTTVKIDGGDMVNELSFHELWPSGLCGHSHGPFNRTNNLWITYYRLVFKATSKEGKLTITDWATPDTPGGPIGQEQIYNFVQVQPFLEL